MVTVLDVACILDHALSEREAGLGPLTDRLGLSGPAIARLCDAWMPGLRLPDLDRPAPAMSKKEGTVAALILGLGGRDGADEQALAAILARRSMGPARLWQDLGLPSRETLSALIARRFPGLAAANARDLPWKTFLHRQLGTDCAPGPRRAFGRDVA